ncbi:DUF2971 domain-containing protein [Aeromonas sp. FDAARGOS 1408]|uniref:DUF2971 domain-containing protein n=1 Tax=Aeromonas TaxID=642 RepID=UPI001C22A54A|nr:DUF2971 domain-containing protein [Aeromonas sp. FDAARGOS 1408]QXC09911.1 DUF2971 domain-containing protein [Aeromonas sp. FDAARGOS 1408]
MNTYYKYTKFYGLDYLKDITVRLSSPSSLNDPFEKYFTKEVRTELLNRASEIFIDENKTGKTKSAPYINYKIISSIWAYGIVSLSETHRNLLMWSHYADEHRGICIGFNEDFMESEKERPIDKYNISHYKPVKVNYDSIRPEHYIHTNNQNDEIRINLLNQLTTKSDVWIYEKEHRCIVPMPFADQVKILNKNEVDEFALDVLDAIKSDYCIDNMGNYTLNNGKNFCAAFSNEKNFAFLKKINPKNIKSIHLGCRINKLIQEAILADISNPSHPLHHIEIYQYEASDERFELIAKKCHPL